MPCRTRVIFVVLLVQLLLIGYTAHLRSALTTTQESVSLMAREIVSMNDPTRGSILYSESIVGGKGVSVTYDDENERLTVSV